MKQIKYKTKLVHKLPIFFLCFWLVLFIFLSIGYSSHTSALTLTSTATIQEHIYDYVYISSVSVSSSSGGTAINYSYKDHEILANTSTPECNNYVTYAVEIVNTTAYPAYITNTGINSMKTGSGVDTTSESVEFINVTNNTTYINPYSSKTIEVKVKNNCTSTSDTSVISEIFFEYSLYKYFDLTINSVPTDANISLTTSEGTFTGTGSVTNRVIEGETVNYSVTRDGYKSKTGSYTMGTSSHTETVTLEQIEYKTLTVTCNISDALITASTSTTTIASGLGSLTANIEKDSTITLSVSNQEYYYTQNSDGTYNDAYTESITMSTDETRSITLNEKPWIDLTAANTDYQTAYTGTVINYHPGYYLVELWGGHGGHDYQNKSTGGANGYIYAMVYFNYNDTIYYTLGGNGEDGKLIGKASRGANGGASANDVYTGASGGFSLLAINTTNVGETEINSGNILMISGGGGGCGAGNLPTRKDSYGSGGAGGNMSSTCVTNSIGYVYYGGDGTYYTGAGESRKGYGGTTTGGLPGKNGEQGMFLQGGEGSNGQDGADTLGGPGGGGYYGGGGGGGKGTPKDGCGGGGGGSSLISTVLGRCTPGNTSSLSLTSNTSSTGGSIRIRYIGKTIN